MKQIIIFCTVLILILSGCEKKLEPVPVGEMNEYKDPVFGFHMKYPKEWKQLGTTGKALFCKSQEVSSKFLDPRTGEEGAQVVAEIIVSRGQSIDEIIQNQKNELKQIAQISPDEQITVSGKPSVKVPYSIKVTSKVSITGFEIFIPGDTALYKLDFVGYGDQFAAHAAVFDAILKSYTLPIIVTKKTDTWQVSQNLETYNTNFFTMQYPDNLEFVQVNKGDKDLVMEMRADRRDCSIHIDVFGAKNLTIEKVWDQNKGKYKAKSTGEIKIDGLKAFWVDYSPVVNINSRAYFVVKNDKVIRTTINCFAPQKDVYFPVLEKCVSSLKLK
jgi:hypothetical protein